MSDRVPYIHFALGILALAASGCTVGPDYRKADQATPERWMGTDKPRDSVSSTPTSRPADLRSWWTVFNDATLSSLIDRALAANLDLRSATIRLHQSRASREIAGSGLWPDVNASASASRSRSGNSSGARTSNSFRAGFDANWEIDVFGGVRRGIEAADADLLATEESRRGVQVSLIAEVAATYFQFRSFQKQLEIARKNLDLQKNSLKLTQDRHRTGFVSRLDVATAESQVAATSSRIPSLEANTQSAAYSLAVLLALPPDGLLSELSTPAALPTPPKEVPIGLPSELLLRRPDIRGAEADVHASTARIGVATADLFPRFALNGSVGLQGSKISALSSIDNRFWSIGPSVSVPLFNAGRIRANIRIQELARDAAVIAYQQAVLTALQEVESSLISYTNEQVRRIALQDAVKSSRESLTLATDLYTAGRRDFLNVLSAQRSLFDAESALIQSDQAILADLVALYKALGGGWDNAATSDIAR